MNSMDDPRTLRRIIFHTPEEWDSHRNDLDGLLATCLSLSRWIGESAPASRERSMALTKLDEFAMWARLAILQKGEDGPPVVT